MIQKEFHGLHLPALGLGCMRLPTTEAGEIDSTQVSEMVAYAMESGVNYFDTGYDYHSGMSEVVMGQILSGYNRSDFYLADKFPGYNPRNWRRVQQIFEEQLTRCGVDYFDFYLFHNVNEVNIDAYLDPKLGIFDYLAEQKRQGKIKHLGFSVHGSTETTKRFLDAYGAYMDFAQIQLNYIDYKFQHADEKIALLAERGIPVWVMEPLRGGKLLTPHAPFDARLQEAFPHLRLHELAFRYIQSLPEVCLTLSGMSNLTQLKDNIAIWCEHSPLSDAEANTLLSIAADITSIGTIPCTACRYCTEKCPKGLDIPKLIGYYNEHTFSGGGFIVPSAVSAMSRDKRPTACIGCRQCETLCPQNIKIADVLASLSDKLNLPRT